jgi:hypothetical protein
LSGKVNLLPTRTPPRRPRRRRIVLNNAQGELTPLEIGIHALGSGLSARDYSDRIGISPTSIAERRMAATVLSDCSDIRTPDVVKRWQHLSAIHSAPQWLWSALVDAIVGA